VSVFDRPHSTPSRPDVDDDSLPSRVRACEDRLLVLSGEDGTNGRVGNLRKDVDGHHGLLKWIGGAVAGSLVTAGLAIYGAGQKAGSSEQERQYMRAAIEELRVQVRELRGYRAPSWPSKGDDQ